VVGGYEMKETLIISYLKRRDGEWGDTEERLKLTDS